MHCHLCNYVCTRYYKVNRKRGWKLLCIGWVRICFWRCQFRNLSPSFFMSKIKYFVVFMTLSICAASLKWARRLKIDLCWVYRFLLHRFYRLILWQWSSAMPFQIMLVSWKSIIKNFPFEDINFPSLFYRSFM